MVRTRKENFLAEREIESAEYRKRLAEMNRRFAEAVPHNLMLGLEIIALGEGTARFKLPYSEKLVGNAATGVLHGGAITALIDAACGAAVFAALGKPMGIATLDLRIDHLGMAPPGRDILASARVYKVTRKVLFIEGFAYCESRDKPIARATGSWVLMAGLDLSVLLDEETAGAQS